MLLRITAPHFTAGLVLKRGAVVDSVLVVTAPPILRYMLGWTEARVREYCKRKHWEVE